MPFVQQGTPVHVVGDDGNTDVSISGVTLNNSILVVGAVSTFGTADYDFRSTGYSKQSFRANQGQGFDLFVLYKHLCAAGAHTIPVVHDEAGFNTYGIYLALEYSSLANTAPDTITGANGNSTSPSVGPTATLSQSSMTVISIAMGDDSAAAGVTTPASYTSRILSLDNTYNWFISISDRVVSTNAAITNTFGTLSPADDWLAAVVPFANAALSSVNPFIGKFGAPLKGKLG